MPKKTAPIEVLEATGEIPIVSVDVPTDYETLVPDPVPVTEHVGFGYDYLTPIGTIPRKYENLLPIVATVLASVATGALLIAAGIIIGAGI